MSDLTQDIENTEDDVLIPTNGVMKDTVSMTKWETTDDGKFEDIPEIGLQGVELKLSPEGLNYYKNIINLYREENPQIEQKKGFYFENNGIAMFLIPDIDHITRVIVTLSELFSGKDRVEKNIANTTQDKIDQNYTLLAAYIPIASSSKFWLDNAFKLLIDLKVIRPEIFKESTLRRILSK